MPEFSAGAAIDQEQPRETRALIMKGGGIKGLAYVGALEVLERRYEFNWFIGTSAGAIAAILLGAGFKTEELKAILQEKNFEDFFDASWYQKPFNLLFHQGLHPADALTDWLDELLAKKLNSHERVRLSKLPYRVTVYASQRGSSALKFDSRDSDADAAFAARCSMSIPWVFTPQHNQGLRAYDGGIQNNYPVKKLKEDYPRAKFISLYLGSETYEPPSSKSVLGDLISIASEAADPEMITKYRDSTVIIDPSPIGTLDFALSPDEKEYLLTAGQVGALKHLSQDSGNDPGLETAVARLEGLKAKVVPAHAAKRRRKSIATWMKAIALLSLFAAALFAWGKSSDGNPEHPPVADIRDPVKNPQQDVGEEVLFTVVDEITGDPIYQKLAVRYRLKGELHDRLDVEVNHRGRFQIPSQLEKIEELNVEVSGYLASSKWQPSNPGQVIPLRRDSRFVGAQTAFAQSIKPDLDAIPLPDAAEYRDSLREQDPKRPAKFSLVNHTAAAITPVVIPWTPEEELDGFALMVLSPCDKAEGRRDYQWPFPSPGAYFLVFLSVYGQRAQLIASGNLQGDKQLTVDVKRVDESNPAEVKISAVAEWRYPE